MFLNVDLLFVVEHSELFATDSFVEIFLRQDQFQELVGIGLVSLVQSEDLLQVNVLHVAEHRERELANCQEWSGEKLSDILIKPTFSRLGRAMMETEAYLEHAKAEAEGVDVENNDG